MHSWGDEGSDKEDDWEYDDEESDEDIQEDEEDEEGRDRDEGDSEEEEDDDDCDEAEAGNWSTDGDASADAPKRTKGVEGRASDVTLPPAVSARLAMALRPGGNSACLSYLPLGESVLPLQVVLWSAAAGGCRRCGPVGVGARCSAEPAVRMLAPIRKQGRAAVGPCACLVRALAVAWTPLPRLL
jgi:hypothetical protein